MRQKINNKSLYILRIAVFFAILLGQAVLSAPLFAASGDEKSDATVQDSNESGNVSDFHPPPMPLITSIQLKEEFEKKWFESKSLILKKQYKEASEVINALGEVMINSGIVNLPDFSSALVVEAKKAIKSEENEGAVLLCEQAIKLSPKLSKFYFELAKIHFSSFSLVKGISAYFKALRVMSENFIDSMLFKVNVLLYLITIIITFMIIFTTFVSLKYFKLFLHDISDMFPRSININIVILYAILLFFIPLFLNLGIFWEFILLVLVGFVYGSKKEKRIFYIIAVLVIILPKLATLTLNVYSFINKEEAKNLYEANQGTWYLEMEQNLEKMLHKYPDDPDLLLSLGLMNKKRGDYLRAEDYYLQGLKIAPDSYELNLNIANVYFAINKTEEAERYYKAAEEIDPGSGTVHYNLNKLYLRVTKLDQADAEFEKAVKLSPDLVEYYSEIIKTTSPNFNRLVIDEQVPKKSYLERYKKYADKTNNIASKFLPIRIKGIAFEDISFIGLGLLLSLLLLKTLNKNYAFTTVCQKCGGAVCYRCQRSIKDNKLCSQCYYIIVKREGVEPKSKITKMLQIKNYVAKRLFISRFISYLLPGTGHILKGLTTRGAIFLLLSIVIGVYILFPNGFVGDLYVTGIDENFFSFGSYILSLLFIIVYVTAIVDIYRSE